jgi:hypothetical protein
MDDTGVGSLEAVIADAGTLLVRLEKYRRGVGPEGAALARAVVALGDRARRWHREDRLDAAVTGEFVGDAERLVAELRELLASIQRGPDYRAARTAHAAGDHGALQRLLPAIFSGLDVVSAPAELLYTVPWLRRARPRPAAQLADAVQRMHSEGLPAEGDDLAPGVDVDLPAVTFATELPPAEPVALRIDGTTLAPPIFRHADTGDHLVHVPHLRTSFTVVLRTTLDEDGGGDAAEDYPRYRAELATALADRGLRVEDA